VHGGARNGNWDRSARRRRTMRVAAPLAVPMALGLTLGVILAVSSGPPVAHVTQTLGAHKKAGTTPAAATDPDCVLIVPPDPLSARGLATPYQLTGPHGTTQAQSGCTESNPDASAFVQATILDPRTGRLEVYEPLVVTRGTTAAAAPVLPRLPAGAITDIMVGFNGGNLTLSTTRQDDAAHCVNGMVNSLFGEVSYCNSAAFYRAAQQAEAEGKLEIPATGVSSHTGQPCPTTRSFDIVDADPSDNVTTEYLLTRGGRTAQDNLANARALPGAVTLVNGSDNALLDDFVLPALGCRPFTAPDLSAGGRPGTSQTLDELSAAAGQRPPVALVPENDPMTLLNGQMSAAKTDLYRLGVGQPQVSLAQTADSPVGFCTNMLNVQTPFLAGNATRLSAAASPVPSEGTNLLTFMAARLSASFASLGCAQYGLKDTVQLALDGRGVPTAVTLILDQQEPK
jgi:hypothetical protein